MPSSRREWAATGSARSAAQGTLRIDAAELERGRSSKGRCQFQVRRRTTHRAHRGWSGIEPETRPYGGIARSASVPHHAIKIPTAAPIRPSIRFSTSINLMTVPGPAPSANRTPTSLAMLARASTRLRCCRTPRAAPAALRPAGCPAPSRTSSADRGPLSRTAGLAADAAVGFRERRPVRPLRQSTARPLALRWRLHGAFRLPHNHAGSALPAQPIH